MATNKKEEFRILQSKLSWLIVPDASTTSKVDGVLQPDLKQVLRPIRWGFFDHETVKPPIRRKLTSQAREELKHRLRKRAGVKGNVESPFFQWKGHDVTFEIEAIERGSEYSLLIHKVQVPTFVSYDGIASLSHLPRDSSSLLYAAVCEVLAMMEGGLSAKPEESVDFTWFPLIRIKDYEPRDPAMPIREDVPWSKIASIGTRHTNLGSESGKIVRAYREKNLCIRDEVVVVDKQSMLVVGNCYVEVESLFDCCILAIHLRHYLLQNPNEVDSAPLEMLKERLLSSIAQPALFTDSVTIQNRWPFLLKEFQIERLIKSHRANSSGCRRDITQSLDECRKFALEAMDWLEEDWPVPELHDTDMENHQSCNPLLMAARKSVEYLVSSALHILQKRTTPEKNKGTLASNIELLVRPENWKEFPGTLPHDIHATMVYVNLTGNIVAHPENPIHEVTAHYTEVVIDRLAVVLKWFVESFLEAAHRKCPEPKCKEKILYHQNVCFCGYKFETWHQSCECRIGPARKDQKRCLSCGHEFVLWDCDEAKQRVVWE